MNKSDIIHQELEYYQDILNYQMTGLASPQLQYTKQQIQQLNKKCDKLYVDYLTTLEKEKNQQQIENSNSDNYIWCLLAIPYGIVVLLICLAIG